MTVREIHWEDFEDSDFDKATNLSASPWIDDDRYNACKQEITNQRVKKNKAEMFSKDLAILIFRPPRSLPTERVKRII
jgi:hypothetical protein